MNFYQPMVDFIDDKQRGRKVPLPHLPWSDEFDPMKSLHNYSDEDLARVSRKTEASAKEKLRDFRSHAKSGFILSQSVSAATITEKVRTTETRKKKQLIRDIKKLKSLMSEEHKPRGSRDAEEETMTTTKFFRGRSAKAIEQQLLTESRKVISEGIDEDIRRQHLGVKGVKVHTAHIKLMDEKMEKELEDSFVIPLENLSHDLKSFDHRTSAFLLNKRWRIMLM